MNEEKWKKELDSLDALIEKQGLKIDKSHYYTNGYDAPFKMWNRRNEVWRVKSEEQKCFDKIVWLKLVNCKTYFHNTVCKLRNCSHSYLSKIFLKATIGTFESIFYTQCEK